MSKIFILIIVLLIFAVIALIVLLKKQAVQRKEKGKQLKSIFEQILVPYIGRELYFYYGANTLFDEDLKPIDFGDNKIYFRLYLHKDSIHPTKFPVSVTSIEEYGYGDNYDYTVNLEIRDTPYEFEIVYCGDIDAIAKSPKLGDIYLPKRKFLEYEVGKKISVLLETTKWDNTNINYIMPKIIA